MSYRNGTYIAFHAGGNTDPTASDIRYYRLIKAWHENEEIDFRFVNSHEKASAVRDTSRKETLMASLRQRLNGSKNFILVVGPTTASDTDWVPFEIQYAVDTCELPIICAYTGYDRVMNPTALVNLLPPALSFRIGSGAARVVHIGFQRALIDDAMRRYDLGNRPLSGWDYYTDQGHRFAGAR